MKNVALFFCFLFFISPVFSQKVKYKKGKILVDKVEKYQVEKIKKGNFATLNEYYLKDMEGNDVLTVKGSALYFEQLPNETSPRMFKSVYVVEAPSLGLTKTIPPVLSLNFRKYLTKQLKKVGFFQEETITPDVFEAFIQLHKTELIADYSTHIDSCNINRVKNAALMAKEFGPLLKRQPGVIGVKGGKATDGITQIASFKLKTKGSYAQVYQVINQEGFVIGNFTIIPKESRANVRMLANEHRKTFRYKVTDKSTATLDLKFTQVAQYLVANGYL